MSAEEEKITKKTAMEYLRANVRAYELYQRNESLKSMEGLAKQDKDYAESQKRKSDSKKNFRTVLLLIAAIVTIAATAFTLIAAGHIGGLIGVGIVVLIPALLSFFPAVSQAKKDNEWYEECLKEYNDCVANREKRKEEIAANEKAKNELVQYINDLNEKYAYNDDFVNVHDFSMNMGILRHSDIGADATCPPEIVLRCLERGKAVNIPQALQFIANLEQNLQLQLQQEETRAEMQRVRAGVAAVASAQAAQAAASGASADYLEKINRRLNGGTD